MIVRIDETSAALAEATTLTSLSVRTPLRSPRLKAAVESMALGIVDRDETHVWIERDAIVRLGRAGGADDKWEAGVDRMLSYAVTQGWVDEHGRVRAHIQ